MELKFLSFFILLVSSSFARTFEEQTQIWHAQILRHSDKCLVESGADRELALRVVRFGEYTDDYKVKCFIKCAVENFDMILDDGSMHHSKTLDIMEVHDPLLIENTKVVEKCFDLKHPDLCEAAYMVSKCVFNSLEDYMKDNVA